MSFKSGRHISEERRKRIYELLFDEIDRIKWSSLDDLDKNLLIETLKETVGRVEHHELGVECPTIDIDHVETTYDDTVAFTLKCRFDKPPTHYERRIALSLSEKLSIPLFIEYSSIDEVSRRVGDRKEVEWVNEGLKMSLSKDKWKAFHRFIRRKPTKEELKKYFTSTRLEDLM